MNRTKKHINKIIEFIMERSPTFSKWVNEEWKDGDGNKCYPINEEEDFDYYECQDDAGIYVILPDLIKYFEAVVNKNNFKEAQNFLDCYWDFYKLFEKEYHTLAKTDTMQNLTRVELFESIDCFDEKTKEKVVELLPEGLKKDYLFCCNN